MNHNVENLIKCLRIVKERVDLGHQFVCYQIAIVTNDGDLMDTFSKAFQNTTARGIMETHIANNVLQVPYCIIEKQLCLNNAYRGQWVAMMIEWLENHANHDDSCLQYLEPMIADTLSQLDPIIKADFMVGNREDA